MSRFKIRLKVDKLSLATQFRFIQNKRRYKLRLYRRLCKTGTKYIKILTRGNFFLTFFFLVLYHWKNQILSTFVAIKYFDQILFSPLKITFKQSSGHFEFFWWPFEFFHGIFIYSQSYGNKVVFIFWFIYSQSCGNEVVFVFWSEPFVLPIKSLLNNLAAILILSGGHFEFFWWPF